MSEKKTLVGIMTILFGVLGVDQFILGQTKKGIYTILLFLPTVVLAGTIILSPLAMVYGIIRFVGSILRGVKVLQMSEADFEEYSKEGPKLLIFL